MATLHSGLLAAFFNMAARCPLLIKSCGNFRVAGRTEKDRSACCSCPPLHVLANLSLGRLYWRQYIGAMSIWFSTLNWGAAASSPSAWWPVGFPLGSQYISPYLGPDCQITSSKFCTIPSLLFCESPPPLPTPPPPEPEPDCYFILSQADRSGPGQVSRDHVIIKFSF